MTRYQHGRTRRFGGHKNGQGQARHPGANRANFRRGKPVDPRLFVQEAKVEESIPYQPTHTFADFGLNATVLANVAYHNYTSPTAIQDQAMLPIMQGRDLVGIANTGTGKTAAFLLPLITKVLADRSQKVLIIAPTRELAVQILEEFRHFSYKTDLRAALAIGGASLNIQTRDLAGRPSFVIGTPGRLMDLAQRRALKLDDYANVVLDEVDRMLDMGFIKDTREIIAKLPKARQSLFFSATLPAQTTVIVREFLTDPVTVSVSTGPTTQNVDQTVVQTRGKDKVELLHQLLIQEEYTKVLVFGRTKWGVKRLEQNLAARGFRVDSIHGNKSQNQRAGALDKLKKDKIQVLIATDVASRGIDVAGISHVINFDPPGSFTDYVHRIGRTGRAGKSGTAITFVD